MYMTQGIWTCIHNVSKSGAEVEDHKIKGIPLHIVSLRSTRKRLKKKMKEYGRRSMVVYLPHINNDECSIKTTVKIIVHYSYEKSL